MGINDAPKIWAYLLAHSGVSWKTLSAKFNIKHGIAAFLLTMERQGYLIGFDEESIFPVKHIGIQERKKVCSSIGIFDRGHSEMLEPRLPEEIPGDDNFNDRGNLKCADLPVILIRHVDSVHVELPRGRHDVKGS